MSLRSPHERQRRRRVPASGAYIYGDVNIAIVEVCRTPVPTHPDQTPVLVRALG
jgi:hypothetical protein